MSQAKWLVTTGSVGTDDNRIYYYSRHGNGVRALIRKIQEMADRTGQPAWAEPWPMDYDFRKVQPKYYRQYPQNSLTHN